MISSPFDGGRIRWGWTKSLLSRLGPPTPSFPPTAGRGVSIGDSYKVLETDSQTFCVRIYGLKIK